MQFNNEGLNSLFSMETNYFIYHATANGDFKQLSEESEQFFYETNTATKKELDELERSIANIKTYLKKNPAFILDKQLTTLIPLIEEEIRVYNDIYTYYSNKEYIEDNFAKGKELHDTFIMQYISLSSKIDTFQSDLLKLATTQENNLLKQENQSPSVGNKMLDLVASSKELSTLFSKSINKQSTLTEDYDSSELESLILNFNESFKELSATDTQTLETEKIDRISFNVFFYQSKNMQSTLSKVSESSKSLETDATNAEQISLLISLSKEYHEQLELLIHYYNQTIEESQ